MKNHKKKKLLAAFAATWLFATESDDDEDVNFIVNKQVSSTISQNRRRVCIKNYVDVIETYNLDDFRHHFRLTKTACEVVLNKIGKKLHTSEIKRGRPPNDVKQQVLVSLWMLANQETYRQLADRFDITISMAWDYFRRTVNALVSIVQDVIQWPKLEQDRKRISLQFYPRQSFPGVIGAIDGTHIPIVTPRYMQNSYINRNKYHSIILQGICSADYKFIDCYAGPPGSIHDARVLRMSPLGRKLTDSQSIIPPEYHLLGDSAYPNTTFLIAPYKDNGHLTRRQRNFNYKHSSTRVTIEQAFGLLKGRFRILRFVNVYNTALIPKIIVSCCILHNICIDVNDTDIEMFEEISNDIVNDNLTVDVMGRHKRDRIAEMINE